jgi:AraC-like DNA-binding protein
MAVIATLLANPSVAQRVRMALTSRHSVLVCDDWGQLTRECRERPVQLVVVDLHDREGSANFDRMRTLRRECPRVGLIGWCRGEPPFMRDLFEAGRAGFDGVLLSDLDDSPERLLALVEQADARSVASVLRKSLGDVSPLVRDAAMIAVTRAHERLTAEALARQLLVPRRLLTRRLHDAGFPPPQQLLTWGRLIVAAHLLEDASRSADGVALTLDFASGSAFRNLCQRYLHATPQQIRVQGGGAWAVQRFVARAPHASVGGPPLARLSATDARETS